MEYSKQIGERLKEARKKMCWSEGKLAELMLTTQPTINRYENGKTNLNFQTMHKLSRLLKISLDSLVKDIDPFENDNLTDAEINQIEKGQ